MWNFWLALLKIFFTLFFIFSTISCINFCWEILSQKAFYYTHFDFWDIDQDVNNGIDVDAKLTEIYKKKYVWQQTIIDVIPGDPNSGISQMHLSIIKPEFVGKYGSTDSQLAQQAFLKYTVKTAATNAAVTAAPVWLTTLGAAAIFILVQK